MTFEPLGNRIAVALVGAEEVSKGGIFIPDMAKERPQIATVLVYDMESRLFRVNTVVPKHIRRFTRLYGPGKDVDSWGTKEWVVSRIPVLNEKAQKGRETPVSATSKAIVR